MTIRRSIALLFSLSMIHASPAADLDIAFVDRQWDGVTVPAGHQCQKFGGTHGSPALHVRDIPKEANALILEFSDRSYAPMDHGGHGKVGYAIEPGSSSVEVPSIPPHTLDLPEGFWTVAAHGAPKWDKAGAYLPPCSGGKGNAYYVTVRAVLRAGDAMQELGQTVVEMGKY